LLFAQAISIFTAVAFTPCPAAAMPGQRLWLCKPNADSRDDLMPEDNQTVCPFCRARGDGCKHLFAVIDETFATVSGPAKGAFTDMVCRNPEEGFSSEDMADFIQACESSCEYCRNYDNEGGPGMSSLEYWCWSSDVQRDLERLRTELGKH